MLVTLVVIASTMTFACIFLSLVITKHRINEKCYTAKIRALESKLTESDRNLSREVVRANGYASKLNGLYAKLQALCDSSE